MEAEIFGDGQQPGDELPEEFKTMSTEDIQRRWGLWAGLERRQWPRAAAGAPPPPPPDAPPLPTCWAALSFCARQDTAAGERDPRVA